MNEKENITALEKERIISFLKVTIKISFIIALVVTSLTAYPIVLKQVQFSQYRLVFQILGVVVLFFIWSLFFSVFGLFGLSTIIIDYFRSKNIIPVAELEWQNKRKKTVIVKSSNSNSYYLEIHKALTEVEFYSEDNKLLDSSKQDFEDESILFIENKKYRIEYLPTSKIILNIKVIR